MAEYIEREALVKRLTSLHDWCRDERKKGLEQSICIVHDQPAADVVKASHGRWMPTIPDSDVRFFCSECETEISTSWDYEADEMWSYCPRCGAKMKGD